MVFAKPWSQLLHHSDASTAEAAPLKTTTSFNATRISQTTFLITENDTYGEHPFIYAKQHPDSHVLILSDTGSNAPKKKTVTVSNLRDYLETYPIPELDGEPINPRVKDAEGNVAPERQYFLICTHCHYDHIGGIEAFTELENTVIIASGYDKTFLLEDLETHFEGGFAKPPMKLPKYKITRWANDGDKLSVGAISQQPSIARPTLLPDSRRVTALSSSLGIRFLTTPGHTPDSLTWYDEADMALYTGDSFYERFCPKDNGADMPIIFPKEGNLVTYMSSLHHMLRFVRDENLKAERKADDEGLVKEEYNAVVVARRVKIGAAHQTFGRDAEEMLEEVTELFEGIIKGKVPKFFGYPVRGEQNSLWLKESLAKYRVFMPDRLVDEARKQTTSLA